MLMLFFRGIDVNVVLGEVSNSLVFDFRQLRGPGAAVCCAVSFGRARSHMGSNPTSRRHFTGGCWASPLGDPCER